MSALSESGGDLLLHDRQDQSLDESWIPGFASSLRKSLLGICGGHPGAEAHRAGELVVAVGDMDDAGQNRYVFSLQPGRIAVAVELFMMGSDNGSEMFQVGERLEQFGAVQGMLHHKQKLGV